MNNEFYEYEPGDGPFNSNSKDISVRFALEKDEGEKLREKEKAEAALKEAQLMTESDSDLILPRYAKRDLNKPKDGFHPPKNDVSSTT